MTEKAIETKTSSDKQDASPQTSNEADRSAKRAFETRYILGEPVVQLDGSEPLLDESGRQISPREAHLRVRESRLLQMYLQTAANVIDSPAGEALRDAAVVEQRLADLGLEGLLASVYQQSLAYAKIHWHKRDVVNLGTMQALAAFALRQRQAIDAASESPLEQPQDQESSIDFIVLRTSAFNHYRQQLAERDLDTDVVFDDLLARDPDSEPVPDADLTPQRVNWYPASRDLVADGTALFESDELAPRWEPGDDIPGFVRAGFDAQGNPGYVSTDTSSVRSFVVTGGAAALAWDGGVDLFSNFASAFRSGGEFDQAYQQFAASVILGEHSPEYVIGRLRALKQTLSAAEQQSLFTLLTRRRIGADSEGQGGTTLNDYLLAQPHLTDGLRAAYKKGILGVGGAGGSELNAILADLFSELDTGRSGDQQLERLITWAGDDAARWTEVADGLRVAVRDLPQGQFDRFVSLATRERDGQADTNSLLERIGNRAEGENFTAFIEAFHARNQTFRRTISSGADTLRIQNMRLFAHFGAVADLPFPSEEPTARDFESAIRAFVNDERTALELKLYSLSEMFSDAFRVPGGADEFASGLLNYVDSLDRASLTEDQATVVDALLQPDRLSDLAGQNLSEAERPVQDALTQTRLDRRIAELSRSDHVAIDMEPDGETTPDDNAIGVEPDGPTGQDHVAIEIDPTEHVAIEIDPPPIHQEIWQEVSHTNGGLATDGYDRDGTWDVTRIRAGRPLTESIDIGGGRRLVITRSSGNSRSATVNVEVFDATDGADTRFVMRNSGVKDVLVYRSRGAGQADAVKVIYENGLVGEYIRGSGTGPWQQNMRVLQGVLRNIDGFQFSDRMILRQGREFPAALVGIDFDHYRSNSALTGRTIRALGRIYSGTSIQLRASPRLFLSGAVAGATTLGSFWAGDQVANAIQRAAGVPTTSFMGTASAGGGVIATRIGTSYGGAINRRIRDYLLSNGNTYAAAGLEFAVSRVALPLFQAVVLTTTGASTWQAQLAVGLPHMIPGAMSFVQGEALRRGWLARGPLANVDPATRTLAANWLIYEPLRILGFRPARVLGLTFAARPGTDVGTLDAPTAGPGVEATGGLDLATVASAAGQVPVDRGAIALSSFIAQFVNEAIFAANTSNAIMSGRYNKIPDWVETQLVQYALDNNLSISKLDRLRVGIADFLEHPIDYARGTSDAQPSDSLEALGEWGQAVSEMSAYLNQLTPEQRTSFQSEFNQFLHDLYTDAADPNSELSNDARRGVVRGLVEDGFASRPELTPIVDALIDDRGFVLRDFAPYVAGDDGFKLKLQDLIYLLEVNGLSLEEALPRISTGSEPAPEDVSVGELVRIALEQSPVLLRHPEVPAWLEARPEIRSGIVEELLQRVGSMHGYESAFEHAIEMLKPFESNIHELANEGQLAPGAREVWDRLKDFALEIAQDPSVDSSGENSLDLLTGHKDLYRQLRLQDARQRLGPLSELAEKAVWAFHRNALEGGYSEAILGDFFRIRTLSEQRIVDELQLLASALAPGERAKLLTLLQGTIVEGGSVRDRLTGNPDLKSVQELFDFLDSAPAVANEPAASAHADQDFAALNDVYRLLSGRRRPTGASEFESRHFADAMRLLSAERPELTTYQRDVALATVFERLRAFPELAPVVIDGIVNRGRSLEPGTEPAEAFRSRLERAGIDTLVEDFRRNGSAEVVAPLEAVVRPGASGGDGGPIARVDLFDQVYHALTGRQRSAGSASYSAADFRAAMQRLMDRPGLNASDRRAVMERVIRDLGRSPHEARLVVEGIVEYGRSLQSKPQVESTFKQLLKSAGVDRLVAALRANPDLAELAGQLDVVSRSHGRGGDPDSASPADPVTTPARHS